MTQNDNKESPYGTSGEKSITSPLTDDKPMTDEGNPEQAQRQKDKVGV